eukprot:12914932-Prorocentrum_lima.AAC.1
MSYKLVVWESCRRNWYNVASPVANLPKGAVMMQMAKRGPSREQLAAVTWLVPFGGQSFPGPAKQAAEL